MKIKEIITNMLAAFALLCFIAVFLVGAITIAKLVQGNI